MSPGEDTESLQTSKRQIPRQAVSGCGLAGLAHSAVTKTITTLSVLENRPRNTAMMLSAILPSLQSFPACELLCSWLASRSSRRLAAQRAARVL